MSDEISSSKFFTKPCFSLEGYLDPTERVTCIGGTPSLLFLGTSKGNIHLIKENKGEYKVLQSNNLSKTSFVDQAIFASALNAVFFVCGKALIEIAVDDFSVQFMRDKVSGISLNTDPTHDDPFTLQLALICDKQILICNKKNDRLDVEYRIHADTRIVTCEYSRNIICYATENEYRIYNRKSRTIVPLFPIELSQLTPCITTVGTEEFILNGMDGLLIFVNGTGVSTKAPLMMQKDLREILFKHPLIFGKSSDGLTVLDMTTTSRNNMEHVSQPNLSSAVILDGVLFVSAGNEISTVDQFSMNDQMEKLFTAGKYDKINAMLDTMLTNDYSEENLLESYTVRSRIAFELLLKAEFEKAAEMFVDAQTTPTEIIHKFRIGCEESSDDLHDSAEYNSFLKEFLLDIRELEYVQAYKQKVDFVLLKLFTEENKLEKLDDIPDFNAIDKGPKYLQSIGKYNKAAEMLYKHSHYGESLKIWKKLALGEVEDEEFNWTDLETRLIELPTKEQLTDALRWVATSNGEMALDVINKRYDDTVDSDLMTILDGLPQLEDYLESRNLDGHAMQKLAEIYIQHILQDKNFSRSKLRDLLVQMPKTNLLEIDIPKDKKDLFSIEILIKESEDDPEKAINKLLQKYKEVELAEKLCSRYAASHPQLGMSLLQEYLNDKTNDPKKLVRIGRLLDALGPHVDVNKVMSKIPDDMKVQELATFLISSIERRAELRDKLRLKELLMFDISPEISQQSKPVIITETSTCEVCSLPITLEQPLLHLPSGYIIHSSCLRHENLCPVTNTIF